MGILLSRAGMGSHPTLTPRRHTALLPLDTTLLLSQHMVRVSVAAAYTRFFSNVQLQNGSLTSVLLYQLQECKCTKCLCYVYHHPVLKCPHTVAETASKAKSTVQNSTVVILTLKEGMADAGPPQPVYQCNKRRMHCESSCRDSRY